MNALTTFSFSPTLSLRTVDRDGEPWFVAKDVCAVLGLDTRNVRRDLDADEVYASQSLNLSGSGGKAPLIISESGLYSLIFKSRKAEALAFKRWVTREVLPAIRKRGTYMTDEVAQRVLAHSDEAVRIAQAQRAESEARLQQVEHALTAERQALLAARDDLRMHTYKGERITLADFAQKHPEYDWTPGQRYECAKFAGELTQREYGLPVQVEYRASWNPNRSRVQLYPPELLDRALKQMSWYVPLTAGLRLVA